MNNETIASPMPISNPNIGDEGMNEVQRLKLELMATKIRKHIVIMTNEAGSGHPGGSLSATDILTVLYFQVMNIKPDNISWTPRDRLVLSKGHAAPTVYAILAERGYFPVSELNTFRKLGSRLQGHPSLVLPGIEMATGSLGQGLSVSNGMALAAKLDSRDYTIFTLIGDGESQEGQVWEGAMAARHYDLDNIVAILDRNRLQIDGTTEEVMCVDSLVEKWKAFGWRVIEIDGHDFQQIYDSLQQGRRHRGDPVIIVANTVKGKGVSFMENQLKYHGKAATDEEREIALKELSEVEDRLRKEIDACRGEE